MRKRYRIIVVGCAVIFCAASAFGQQPRGNGIMGIKSNNSSSHVMDDSTTDSLYYYNMAYADQYSDPQQAYIYIKEYVERHPFATVYPGEVCQAIARSEGYMSGIPGRTHFDYKKHYNWLLHIQPANMERSYQGTVMSSLAAVMSDWDDNGAANMWYNYGLIYGDWTTARTEIGAIRHFQHTAGLDTTAFTIIKYPPDSLVLEGGVLPTTVKQAQTELMMVPNPASFNSSANITMPTSGVVLLQLHDELGVKLKDVFSGYLQTGKQSIVIDIHDLSNGQYYLRLTNPNGIVTQKLIVNH